MSQKGSKSEKINKKFETETRLFALVLGHLKAEMKVASNSYVEFWETRQVLKICPYHHGTHILVSMAPSVCVQRCLVQVMNG